MKPVEVVDVRKRFGSITTIHGVSVTMDEGAFVVLVGPSGCGKSTLLRMIAGLETVSSGEIRIGGRVVNHMAPKDRDIAMVFQNYALYPQMTVAQNMAFSLEMAKVPRDEIQRKVKQASSILGLDAMLDRRPGALSGGQRQRVAMGRAIVRDPQVFLFDEPLSNLDAKLRVQMRGEIKALQKRLGTTTVYVTHDQIEAMTMADKIVVLRDGRVEQIGAPLELFDRPANLFVAAFLGSPSMNFLEGQISDSGATFTTADGTVLAIAGAPRAALNGPVTFGFRPQDVAIDALNGTLAEVVVTEPTGTETHVVVKLAGKGLTCVFKQRVHLGIGEKVPLSLRDATSHFFDPQTTNRIG
ncbi:MAG TPA: sn-glycerol-3-phosphate ABC transporter ATP-binding protein UgpC [Burkholderiales bacterium]|nr:sn-glycerol-3-phosphate ABC transporter ATP-binding protein UgpC [Burkholderiales bacterium]